MSVSLSVWKNLRPKNGKGYSFNNKHHMSSSPFLHISPVTLRTSSSNSSSFASITSTIKVTTVKDPSSEPTSLCLLSSAIGRCPHNGVGLFRKSISSNSNSGSNKILKIDEHRRNFSSRHWKQLSSGDSFSSNKWKNHNKSNRFHNITNNNPSITTSQTTSSNDDELKGKATSSEKETGQSTPVPKVEAEPNDTPPLPTPKKKRSLTSTERNFITPIKAMQDYLLTSGDIAGLRKTMRRSPHADEPPITVLWKKDAEQRALEIWGSWEGLKKEKRRRGDQYNDDLEEKASFEQTFTSIKRILKKYRKEIKPQSISLETILSPVDTLFHGSGRIVLTAVAINGANFVIKIAAWSMTGSHSLFAEAIHSLADTINQVILAYGIHKSSQSPNKEHPYGYANMRHVASLISGVGIFCVGAGLSFYHGIMGLIAMEPIGSLYWAFYILAGSFVSEGATLYIAVNAVRKRAKELNISFKDYILRGQDPSLNVVILEDAAAVAGVGVAAMCMGISMWTNSPIADSVGSLVIGGLLGGVASFIIYSNSAALVGRSIPRDNLEKINSELEQDVMIRAIHDVKGIDMGNTTVRYKAEVDFDGRELTRAYLDKQDVQKMLKEIREINTSEDLEGFILKHGENIVDTLGAEIDRIETRLKQSHPEIRHCDLEIL